jgi:hypothetical protein
MLQPEMSLEDRPDEKLCHTGENMAEAKAIQLDEKPDTVHY